MSYIFKYTSAWYECSMQGQMIDHFALNHSPMHNMLCRYDQYNTPLFYTNHITLFQQFFKIVKWHNFDIVCWEVTLETNDIYICVKLGVHPIITYVGYHAKVMLPYSSKNIETD